MKKGNHKKDIFLQSFLKPWIWITLSFSSSPDSLASSSLKFCTKNSLKERGYLEWFYSIEPFVDRLPFYCTFESQTFFKGNGEQ